VTDLEKVKQDSYAIYYITNPSIEVQFEAVKQNSDAIFRLNKMVIL